MNKNQFALASIAMDIKRVALAYFRGSVPTAKRFFEEALKRKEEIDQASLKPYLRKLLVNLNELTSQPDNKKIAEDALMYSTLFQNAAVA